MPQPIKHRVLIHWNSNGLIAHHSGNGERDQQDVPTGIVVCIPYSIPVAHSEAQAPKLNSAGRLPE